MAGVRIRGFEELVRNTERLTQVIAVDAINAAEDAAADVVREAVAAAAAGVNRRTGRLAASVGVFEGKDKSSLTGSQRRWVLIGPGKKKGFYGFFLEEGWTWRRNARQRKGAETRQVEARPWFPDPASLEKAAWDAGVRAFEDVVARELGRMGG